GDAHLEILEPIQKTIPCISLPHSPPTDMESTIYAMEGGAPVEFDRVAEKIKGKTVMVSSEVKPVGTNRRIHRSEKYGRSVLAGGEAFIFVNHYPGFGPATGGIGHDGEGLILGISISKEDGAFIDRLIKRKGAVKIRIVTTDKCEEMVSWNILGDLPGDRDPETIVMLGCHYDGHDISQGAVDPASGAVSVLEAARVLAKYAPTLPYTLRVALWGIEEIGLIGSREYVSEYADQLSKIRFYLNMDSAGSLQNNRDIIINEWPELEALFNRYSVEMAHKYKVAQSLSAFSDHFPFFIAGVPTGGMQSAIQSFEGRGYGHTHHDTVDKVDMTCLREASTLAARIALRVASEENWPVQKRDEKMVQELLDSPDYREEEEFRDRLDAYYKKARETDKSV
ncbi:MAG: M28 family metallopeptidase, partial [Anaerolineaceae bacterium]|nr:M28 family metallopeptidase [Anaerolineaceae bacterium]